MCCFSTTYIPFLTEGIAVWGSTLPALCLVALRLHVLLSLVVVLFRSFFARRIGSWFPPSEAAFPL